MLVNARGPAWATERAELTGLLRVAREAAAGGADAKARAFFDLLGELAAFERDPNVKVLVFTEFVQTQDMLLGLLEQSRRARGDDQRDHGARRTGSRPAGVPGPCADPRVHRRRR